MTYSIKNRFALASVVALLGAGIAVSACSSSNKNSTPPTGDSGTGGAAAGGTAGASAGGSSAGGGGSSAGGASAGGTAGSGNTGGAGTGGEGTDAGDAGPGPCTQDPNQTCGTCPPSTSVEFLNHCGATGVTCIKYDNTAHGIPATLPALNVPPTT